MTLPPHAADANDRPVSHAGRPLHILLVADGSPDSTAGAETINALSLPPGSEITVLTKSVADATPGGQVPEPASPPAAALLQRDALAVTSHALPEISARHLQEFTAIRRTDLVVVGAVGPAPSMTGKLREALNPLVEQLAMPVLVARAPFNGLRRILLAYDGSPDSRAAVEYLTRLPLPKDSRVTILYVLTGVPTIEVAPVGGPKSPRLLRSLSAMNVRDEPHPTRQRSAQTLVAQAVEVLTRAGIDARSRVLWGDAANAILHKAASAQVDLLVAGSRGLSGVWTWLLGSVSRRLLRDGRWPVLIVRGELPAGLRTPSGPSPSLDT